MKFILNILLIITLSIVGLFVYDYFFSPSSIEKITQVSKGQIDKVDAMAQLCVVDIYNEMPVLDTINSKVLFAIQKQKGSVSFDLDNMSIDTDGDTITVTLPAEIVELYESTDANSWEVIDTKAIGNMAVIRSGKFTNEEENIIKAKIKKKSKQILYRNGTIAKARVEAARNLEALMSNMYRKPVRVIDPTPQGVFISSL